MAGVAGHLEAGRDCLDLLQAISLQQQIERAWPSSVYRPGLPGVADAENGQLQFHQAPHIYRGLFTGNGFGKALAHGERVLTPQGYVPIECIRAGDRVFGADGHPTQVTGVFPQGLRPCYRVTFNDGSSIICDLDHLWTVQLRNNRFSRPGHEAEVGQWQTMSLSQIIAKVGLSPSPVNRPLIPSCRPVCFPEQPVPIDPYVLGLMLGDGGLTGTSARFSKPDGQLIEQIARFYPVHRLPGKGFDYNISRLIGPLRELGLAGKRSWEKFIPSAYLLNSPEVRLAVLQGLMDTDGSAGINKHEFSTTSPQLAREVAFLVESLGGTAVTSSRQSGYTYRGEKRTGRVSYRVFIWIDRCPYRLERKAAQWRPIQRQSGRLIVQIAEAGIRAATCIKVDAADGLFLADHCIVTHNTTCVSVEVDWWVNHTHPYQLDTIPQRPVQVLWVCQKLQQFQMQRPKIERWWTKNGYKWNGQRNCFHWPDGSAVWVISSECDWETIQGVGPDLVVIDEECDESLWHELEMRRRADSQARYVISATATKGMRWMYRSIYRPWQQFHAQAGYGETEAMRVQRHRFDDPALRDIPGIWCWPRGGLHDNPASSEADVALYRSRTYLNEADRQVRLYGGFRDFNGTPVFCQANLEGMRQHLRPGMSGRIVAKGE